MIRPCLFIGSGPSVGLEDWTSWDMPKMAVSSGITCARDAATMWAAVDRPRYYPLKHAADESLVKHVPDWTKDWDKCPNVRVWNQSKSRTQPNWDDPDEELSCGMLRRFDSLLFAVQVAYWLAYKTFVFVGVDCLSNHYHPMLDVLEHWSCMLEERNVLMYNASPFSALAAFMPDYQEVAA